MSDDQLLAMYAKIVQAREPRTRAGCVPPEALQALVEHRGAEVERLRTLNHSMSCPACRRELDLLRAVRATRPSVVRQAIPIALAASLLLAVGITYAGRARREGEPIDPFRSANDVMLVTPRGLVAAARPLSLVWRSVPGATGYELSVVADDGTPLGQFRTRDTTFSLSPTVPLRQDVEYAWTVTARTADGERTSVPARFRLRAP